MRPPLPRILALAAAVLATALAGCEEAPVRHPKTVERVVLSDGQTHADVNIGIGSSVQVVLAPPMPGSGLAWEIATINNRILEQMGPFTGPGSSEVAFYSLKPGKSVTRFVLVRPGEQVSVPAAMCELTVRVRE